MTFPNFAQVVRCEPCKQGLSREGLRGRYRDLIPLRLFPVRQVRPGCVSNRDELPLGCTALPRGKLVADEIASAQCPENTVQRARVHVVSSALDP